VSTSVEILSGRTNASTGTYLGSNSRSELSTISRELVQLYEGNQIQYLLNWLASLISDPSILRRYQELAVFSNIVRLLVDHVSTLGQVPVRVIWLNRDTRKPDDRAQELWDEIVSEWMSASWDAYVQTLSARIELLKTVVAAVEWDEFNNKLALTYYTPAEIDVANDEANPNTLEPDVFKFTDETGAGVSEEWKFTSRDPGPSGVRVKGEKITRLPVIDPRTGRSVIPFIPFRTITAKEYFVWDGQHELRNAQEFVNRLYTRLSVLAEMGTNKVLVLSGTGWADSEGRISPIPLDITKAIKEPDDPFGADGGRPKIRWDGPEVAAEIKSCLEIVSHWIETTAATFRINASAIRAKNEATSGYALQIESAALKAKHSQTKNAARPQLLRLVQVMKLYWDHYGPVAMRLGPDVYPTIVIPDYSSAATTREEVDGDIALVKAGLKRRMPVIYRYEPGIPPGAAAELADEDPEEEIQENTPLDSGQITALQEIAQAVAAGTMPYLSGMALVKMAVPTVEDCDIVALLGPPAAAAIAADPGLADTIDMKPPGAESGDMAAPPVVAHNANMAPLVESQSSAHVGAETPDA